MKKQQVESCILKVLNDQYSSGFTEKKVPQIVLCGEWLIKVGFTAKTEYVIECYSGIITLKAI